MAGSGRHQERGVAAGGLRVALLGPLEVSVGGRPVVVTAPRQRALLAVLAVSAGRSVPVDRLAMAVWDADLPGYARGAVQTYMARLRRVLGRQLIGTSSDGYVLRVEPDQVDALRFLRLLDDAAATQDAMGERALLVQALALWQGAPFEGVRSAWLAEVEARRLTERYLAAIERRIDLDLADGRAGELVPELSDLTARYPLRESLWVRLLVVLDRCGRQAEALERYEAVRVRLVEELGADPGPGLQQVHADLLAGRPPELGRDAVGDTVRRVVPRQLPVDIAGFTGREQELADLETLLGHGDDEALEPVVVSAVVGTAGVGKSALAIHAAHRLAGRFPDGQLYVNLQGAAVGLAPLGPGEVLGRFLRGMGVAPAAIPGDLEEAAALWRSQVAGRRLLVVLDNAADADQVRPLLPAAPGCGVLVTSRSVLASLEGAQHLHLDVLAPEEAIQLLGRLAGPQRVAAEPQAAAEVARLCGQLPLALRIAGARLAARPSWPVRTLADRLADAQARLDELELADIGVRASFTVSDQQLRASGDPADRAAAAAFGLLGMLDGPELGIPVAARLLDTGEQAAERVLERLADAHLLETPAPGRYRLHDLLRLYARELAAQRHPEPERAAALTRALGFYAATTWGTLAVLRPGDHRLARADDRWRNGGLELADEHSALAWLEAERANLLAAVQQAATTPGIPNELATQLAHGLFGFLWVRGQWDDWVRVSQLALAAAQRTGDRAAQAHAHNDLGLAHYRQGRYEQALICHQEGLAIFRELGDRRGQAASLNNLGIVYEEEGRYPESRACHKASLAICRELGNQRGQAISLGNLGNVHERQGRYDQALACQQESLAIFHELDDRYGQAVTLNNLGKVHMRRERHDEALASLKASLTIFRELGDRDGQAHSLTELGVVYRWQGRPDRALACQQQGLAIRRELGDRRGQAESLRELGETLRALDRSDAARAHWREALAIFEQLGTTHADQIRALLADEPSSQTGA